MTGRCGGSSRSPACPPRRRRAVGSCSARSRSGFGVGLMTAAGYLISRAAEQPPILSLTVTIVAVRFFGLARPLARYLERLVSHDVALRALGRIRARFYERIEPLAPAQLEGYRRGELLGRMVGDVDVAPGALRPRARRRRSSRSSSGRRASAVAAAFLPAAAGDSRRRALLVGVRRAGCWRSALGARSRSAPGGRPRRSSPPSSSSCCAARRSSSSTGARHDALARVRARSEARAARPPRRARGRARGGASRSWSRA